MNKTDLIEVIAKQSEISKATAGRALKAMTDGLTSTLKKRGRVSLAGFGTFSVSKRVGRTGRNSRTGAAINGKAAGLPEFRPSKALRDAL